MTDEEIKTHNDAVEAEYATMLTTLPAEERRFAFDLARELLLKSEYASPVDSLRKATWFHSEAKRRGLLI
jgi:hypothetical protein